MADQPNVINQLFNPLYVQKYQKYLPTAFDEGLTMLEKLNKVIVSLNQIGKLSNDVLDQWNQAIDWIMSDGLDASIDAKLDSMVTDGTLEKIINEDLFASLNELINENTTNIESNTNSIDDLQSKHDTDISSVNTNISNLQANVNQRGINTKDYPTLQDALNVGGVIYLTSDVDVNQILKIKSGTHLIGVGRPTLKRTANINGMMINLSDELSGGYDASHNVIIENIVFDCNNSNVGGDCTSLAFGHSQYIQIRNCRFIGNSNNWHDLELNATRDAIVEFCEFEDYKGNAQALQIDLAGNATVFPWFGPYDNTACQDITIRKNTFRHMSMDAIGSHYAVAGIYHRNIKILDNDFEDIGEYCVRAYGWSEFEFAHNKVYNVMTGVRVEPYDTNNRLNRINIHHNTMIGCDKTPEGRSIHITGYADMVNIDHNIIAWVGKHGIGVDYSNYINVDNNQVQFAGQAGIWIFGSKSGTCNGNIAKNNNQDSIIGKYDFMIGSTGSSDTTDITATGNRAGSVSVSQTSGIGLIGNIFDSLTESSNTNIGKSMNSVSGVWS